MRVYTPLGMLCLLILGQTHAVVSMQFLNWYPLFLIILIFLISCTFAENKGPSELYGNIYLAKNVPHTQVKRKFIEIMDSVLHAIESTRKLNSNGLDAELKGIVVILENIENYNHETHSEEGIIDTNNISHNQSYILENFKNLLGLIKDYPKIKEAIVTDRKESEIFARDDLSIEYPSYEPKYLQRANKKPNRVTRDSYADSCLKLAIRKCFKALVAASKSVCKVRYRCTSGFQSYFREQAKVGCITNFDYRKLQTADNTKKKRISAKFRDATREGYLDACIPYMVPNYKKASKTTLRNDTLINYFTNVLRKANASEKSCHILTGARCATACFYALRESCAKYECFKRTRTAFNKACKDECRRAYRVISLDSSSSSSESD